MKYILNNGGNVIIFAEGYWNLDDDGQKIVEYDGEGNEIILKGADDHNSDQWLIQDLNVGAFKLAKEIGVEIIPTILHYDEENNMGCYAFRGKPFKIEDEANPFDVKNEVLKYMQTEYYRLMEKYSYNERAILEKDKTLKEKWGILKKTLISKCDIPSCDYKLDLNDEKLIGKAKVANPIVTNEEAFEHLNKLIPSKQNAFLLSKKLSGTKR